MTERLEAAGIRVSPYNPRLEQYFRASRDGWLKTFVVRCDGNPIGYCNVYVTHDMHNGDLIAQEDTMFVDKQHRKGIGRTLVYFGLSELKKLGVTRLSVLALTDLRVAKLWRRMGFKDVAQAMVYEF